jgi:hypothetical protein
VTLIAGFGAVAGCCCAYGQAGPEVGSVATPRFQELVSGQTIVFSALPAVPTPTDLLLINGVPVDQRQFPTVFRMTTGGTCTATLVGPAAMLTAAHCVPNGAQIAFVLGTRTVRSLCEQARGYHPQFNQSEDWAMCLLEFPVTGINYETVAAEVPAVGKRVVLTGYGCTQQGGPLDGTLRAGSSDTVTGSSTGFPAETSSIYTKSNIDAGGAVLCPGDSGGPLFVFSGNSFNDARTLVGVNSRTTFQFGVSIFAATGSTAGKQFFRDWTERHGQKICGVNTDQNCR